MFFIYHQIDDIIMYLIFFYFLLQFVLIIPINFKHAKANNFKIVLHGSFYYIVDGSDVLYVKTFHSLIVSRSCDHPAHSLNKKSGK